MWSCSQAALEEPEAADVLLILGSSCCCSFCLSCSGLSSFCGRCSMWRPEIAAGGSGSPERPHLFLLLGSCYRRELQKQREQHNAGSGLSRTHVRLDAAASGLLRAGMYSVLPLGS